MRIAPIKAGVALGAAVALTHAAWAGLVLIGWAQPLADFMFWIHFVRPPYTILPFDGGRAGLLLLVSGVGGFVLGAILALIWNAMQPRAVARAN